MRISWIFLAVALLAGSSSAQVVSYTFTTAADSTATDFSSCADVSVRCDQSLGDASTDAKASVMACAASSDDWTKCKSLRDCPATLPDATDVSIGAPPVGYPYLMTHVGTAPSGDTARMGLTCSKFADIPARGCKTVPFSATGTFGPYTIAGSTMRFDLDGNVATAATTGASATVEGCTTFATDKSTCSCDMVNGETSCATYDGNTGSAGFVAIAPRTVTVTIVSAAQAGTFELCTW